MTTPLSPRAEFAFTLTVHCAAPVAIGRIDGGAAQMIAITGGSIDGPRLLGEVLPGADWPILREGGAATVEARYALRAADGTIIQVWNSATARIGADTMRPSALGTVAMITAPRFLAPEGPHAWLNHGVFVGTLMPDRAPGGLTVRIGIYQMV